LVYTARHGLVAQPR